MLDTLPSQVFFDPKPAFLNWFVPFLRGRVHVDAGAGVGHLAAMLQGRNVATVSLDAYQREEHESFVLPIDARKFNYAQGMVVTICRPDRGPWAQEVIELATEAGATVVYCGRAHWVENDLDFPDLKVTRIMDSAGMDDEVVYTVEREKGMYEEKTTWCLIQCWADRPNAPKGAKFDNPYWAEDSPEDDDGDAFWINVMGGRRPKQKKDKVLERVTGVDYCDLDHTKTYLAMPHDKKDAGWLSRSGKWYPCDSREHDTYASLIFKKDGQELMDEGWVKVWRKARVPSHPYDLDFCYLGDMTMTVEQVNWLRMQGHNLEEYDLKDHPPTTKAQERQQVAEWEAEGKKKGKHIRRKVEGD